VRGASPYVAGVAAAFRLAAPPTARTLAPAAAVSLAGHLISSHLICTCVSATLLVAATHLGAYLPSILTPPPIAERGVVITAPVCLSVCLFVGPPAYLWNCASDLHQVFVHVTCGRDLVIHWRCCDMFCTSGLCVTSGLHIVVRNRRRERRILKVTHKQRTGGGV